MDPETAAGETAKECAEGIFKATLCGEKETIPLRFLPVIWIRAVCPWIYFRALEWRALKLAATHHATQTIQTV